jgi:uncharacterized membrane protein YGL010W
MSRVDRLLSDYAYYHQSRGNIVCHVIGIPLITYSILALLLLVPLKNSVTAAEALIGITFFYYLTLDYRLAICMLLLAALFDLLARAIHQTPIAVGALVTGWVFQGIGHAVYEKNSPAFLRNLIHLLIGPIFLLNELFHFRSVSAVLKIE